MRSAKAKALSVKGFKGSIFFDLSAKIKKAAPKSQAPLSFGGNLKDQVAQFESAVIQESLGEHAGKVAAAAEKLGLTRAGLYKKINKYKIDVNK